MNKKDYSAIAEIIKPYFYGKPRIKKEFVNELADYFEREDNKIWEKQKCRCAECSKHRFNRQQFLKDCGVDGK